MRIITERTIREFWQSVKGAESERREKVMRQWMEFVNDADWSDFSELKNTFNASDVYGNCTIFDVGGNKYRIIAKVEYQKHLIFIRAVLTHSEYDKNKWQADCR